MGTENYENRGKKMNNGKSKVRDAALAVVQAWKLKKFLKPHIEELEKALEEE